MENFGRGVILFLVLMVALSSGSSYLALNQASKGKSSTSDQKMMVALVNEDQGTTFNGKRYEFGNEFTKDVEKDNKHNWYVVSRGIAESGLKRDAYNMMIVIPNDFSQKALSIDAIKPEQVVLNYKINASGNSNMKSKIEKTVNSILGDFNRKIIDVYFSSVIGNLQDAQDNVGTLVRNEQAYTNLYNKSINNPLSGYTSQFGMVENNTTVSKNGVKGLQDILKNFEASLSEITKQEQPFQTNFLGFEKMQDAHHLLAKDFAHQLSSFDQDMNRSDVLQKLDDLSSANSVINAQFHQMDSYNPNILSESAALQTYLYSAKDRLNKLDTNLAAKLQADMQKSIAAQLKTQLKNSSSGEQNIYLNRFFSQPNKNVQKSIQSQISQLPSLNTDEVDSLDLNETTKTQLKNVMAVTNKYDSEFGNSLSNSFRGLPLINQITKIKNDLVTNGLTITDSVNIPKNKDEAKFKLTIPGEFSVNQVLLTLPNNEEMDYTHSYLDNGEIALPSTDKGEFKVKLKVNLKSTDTRIDVFQPIIWNWELDQQNIENVDTPVPPPGDGTTGTTTPTDGGSGTTSTAPPPVAGSTSSSTVQPLTTTDTTPNSTDSAASTGTSDGSRSTGSDSSSTETSGDVTQPPVQNVEIINNQMTHQVASSLSSNSTNVLINAASETVSEYEKMLSLYSLYFGIGIDSFNNPGFASKLSQTNLKGMATKDSLYYLFNKRDIVDVLSNYVAEQTFEEVRQQTLDLKEKIDGYVRLVTNAMQNSDQMAEMVKKTTEQAGILNTNLADTLKNLAAWREASLKLQDGQIKILSNNDGEQSAVVSLDSGLSSLLVASQSLADQSEGNLNTAEHVYETFNAIDTQAKSIENSGTSLVKKAGDLSNNLTKKLIDDKNFAKDFAGVLANSRIGERPNENLLSFLSEPVQTKSAGEIVASDAFIPYFIVLICFIVTLFTAYVVSSNERRRIQKDSFKGERSLAGNNLPITITTASIGIAEGLVIGIFTGYLLQIVQDKFMLWTGLVTLIVTTMLLVTTYLLRQLRMIGMFIILVIFSMYLFLTGALGLQFDKLSLASKLRKYSPLQYIEQFLMGFGSADANSKAFIISLLVLILMSLIGHMFVINRFSKSEEVENEGISETI